MFRGRGIAIGVVASALLAGGCGGGGDETVLTKAEFVAQANAICQRAVDAKGKAIEVAFAQQRKSGKPIDAATEERLLTDVALPPIDQMVEELSSLPLPSDDERASAVVDDLRKAVDEAQADPHAVVSGETNLFPRALAEAKAYGLRWCSEI